MHVTALDRWQCGVGSMQSCRMHGSRTEHKGSGSGQPLMAWEDVVLCGGVFWRCGPATAADIAT